MKLHLLHGPANAASRRHLVDIKKKFDKSSVVVFDPLTSSGQVLGYLMTQPLLYEERLIVWENPPEDFILDSSLITNNSSLVLWFDHEVSQKKPVLGFIKKFNGTISYFPEAKEISVFPLLDLLVNGDKKAFLEIDKLKRAGFDIHYLMTMIFYLLRTLVVTPKTAPDFVKRKIARQRANFSAEKIKNLYNLSYTYRSIIEIDFKIKNGFLENQQAEFSLVNLFCHQI